MGILDEVVGEQTHNARLSNRIQHQVGSSVTPEDRKVVGNKAIENLEAPR